MFVCMPLVPPEYSMPPSQLPTSAPILTQIKSFAHPDTLFLDFRIAPVLPCMLVSCIRLKFWIHVCNISLPLHPSWIDHVNDNDIKWRVQIMKFFAMQLSPSPTMFPFWWTQYPKHSIFRNTQRYVLSLEWETKIHTYSKQEVTYIF
jgi:hypothetical protein